MPGSRSRTCVRSKSAMALPPVIRGSAQQLEAATAIDAGALQEIRLHGHELRRLVRVVVHVLDDDAVLPEGQIEQIPAFPRVLHAVDQGVAPALEHVYHLSA